MRQVKWFVSAALLLCVVARGAQAQVTIGAGGQLIVGGFDPSSRQGAAKSAADLEAAIPQLMRLGVTSHEVYVRWNLCEVEPEKWDWELYDRYDALYKKHGLKWVPFIICGSAYSLPDWYYKKPGSQGYVCLEHGQESDVQSLWNPSMRQHVARFLKAFCDHYGKSGRIESMLLGVTGNYGEAIYVATGDDWTADVHGKYHTHAGFWAGDPFAVEGFRAWVKDKYATTERLRAAWGEKAPDIDQVRPFLRNDAPEKERAWVDFVDWYVGSMTDYSRFWMAETRKHFPQGDIYLCTGGNAVPEHGSDFGAQCKLTAEVGGGVRITNEASDYGLNFTYTRWVASAGSQYGAYYSFEPAGEVNERGVIARVYNAAASGARGLHYYWPNLVSSPAATDNFIRTAGQFRQLKPIVEIAVYYPTTSIKLAAKPGEHVNQFFAWSKALRDRFDFAYLSDGQIRDGGLKSVKALVLMQGCTMERKTWDLIADWLRSGRGMLLHGGGMNQLRDVEGDTTGFAELLNHFEKQGDGVVIGTDADGKGEPFRRFVSDALAKAPQLSPNTRAMLAADGREDGLFVTLIEPDRLLWYNPHDKEQVTAGGFALPPISIVSQAIASRR